jgi:hypothetical protein|tara:strand:+ start:246 stop:500 length:255 start_codon:yes stop_codon:yes gene_type:complete
MDFKSILIGALSTALLFVSLGASNGKTNSINPTPPSLETTESTNDIHSLGGAVLDDNGNVWQVCYGEGWGGSCCEFWYVKVVND